MLSARSALSSIGKVSVLPTLSWLPFLKRAFSQETKQMPDMATPYIAEDIICPEILPDFSNDRGTSISKLSNGLSVATVNVPGAASTVGLFFRNGSRVDTVDKPGLAYMCTSMWLKSTKTTTADDLLLKVEHMGGSLLTSASREHSMMAIDCMRPDIHESIDIIADSLYNSLFNKADMDRQALSVKHEIEAFWSEPELVIPELIHSVAWPNNPLGNHVMGNLQDPKSFSHRDVADFARRMVVPSDMVLVAVGCDHEKVVEHAETAFGSLTPCEDPHKTGLSRYTGGFKIVTPPEHIPDPIGLLSLSHIAIAFQGTSWLEDDIYAQCVLQILMGGGGSFSAGGPGKGMFSRLYTEVLSRYHWVVNAVAFNNAYEDTSVFGIYGSCVPEASAHLCHVITNELFRMLEMPKVDELKRAKIQLRSSLLFNLESRQVIFEDLGRQLLTYGTHLGSQYIIERIESVTADDIVRVARKMLRTKPSFLVYGQPHDTIPDKEWVDEVFSKIAEVAES